MILHGMLYPLATRAQEKTTVIDSSKNARRVIAGDYRYNSSHNFFFGKHYRREWRIPVTARLMYLDTAFGGLIPYQSGGGRQSKSLRLRDREGREYVIRSLDKSFGRALPETMQGTFVEDIIDDQVTVAHPYSAFTIPPLAKAAGILHTNPFMRFVPSQPALDSFNEEFGNRLFLVEQRPDEDWSDAPNFGGSAKIVGTDKFLEEKLEENDHYADQLLYVRSRLFDMFIGDWGRHEDQWRWARFDTIDRKIYRPIPRDRDQAYTKFDGLLPKLVLKAANLDHLQTFGAEIKDISSYTFPSRYLDRVVANEPTLDQWLQIANELKTSLTDELIESSVRQMPPEVFPVSGPEIIAKLKARRDKLPEYAKEYYLFLARHVTVTGSEEREYFEVRRLNDEETSVKIFPVSKEGKRDETPVYSRVFKASETRDVRLYGIDGADVFDMAGSANEGLKVRFIGGPARDSIIDRSEVKGENDATEIYDDHHNVISAGKSARVHLSKDSAIHSYEYDEFKFHKKGMKFSVFYDNPDRLYAGMGYSFRRHMWRKEPWGFEQGFFIRYSFTQNAFSLLYDAKFYELIGKWNMRIMLNQDFIRWTNFYGLGNETKNVVDDRRYYRMQSNEFLASAMLYRNFRKHHRVEITPYFQSVRVLRDMDRFITEYYPPEVFNIYDRQSFIGGRLGYTFQKVDDAIIPEKGVMFYAGIAQTKNINRDDVGFTTGNGILQLYVPLPGKFSLSLRSGITSVSGQPEFYQYASVGGSQTLRGYRRDRFWGKTAFYNTNELRWITDVKSYIMNGKFGLLAFIDDGRVWMPKEHSYAWHVSYGGGFLLAPFNFVTASVSYGISQEEGRFHIRVSRLLR